MTRWTRLLRFRIIAFPRGTLGWWGVRIFNIYIGWFNLLDAFNYTYIIRTRVMTWAEITQQIVCNPELRYYSIFSIFEKSTHLKEYCLVRSLLSSELLLIFNTCGELVLCCELLILLLDFSFHWSMNCTSFEYSPHLLKIWK